MLEGRAKAAGLTISEFVRDTLLAVSEEQSKDLAAETVLAELMALRSLFLNLSFRTGKEPLTEAEMHKLIERADATKVERARERLQASHRARKQEGADSISTQSEEA